MKRVIIGAFAHESNMFCPNMTTIDKFEYYEGNDVFDHLPVLSVFKEAGIEVIPSIFAQANSYGIVEERTYHYFADKILQIVRENMPIDGIWMYCHGAMSVENIGSGEYRLACDLREVVGDKCIISFGMDLHGNIEEDFANKVNIFRCFHTAPHTDQEDTFLLTARTLIKYLKNNINSFPKLRKVRMILPGEKASTEVTPFCDLIRLMKGWEWNNPAVSCVSIFIGFAWADAKRVSSAVVVVPASEEYSEECSKLATDLSELLFSRRREFDFETLSLPPLETVRTALNMIPRPVCVTDMGDNPTAGTSGGSLVLLKEFINENDGKKILVAGIYDPVAFQYCKLHTIDDALCLNIGINIDEITKPIELNVKYKGIFPIYGYDILSNPPIVRCEGCHVSLGEIDLIITDKPFAFTQVVNFDSCHLNTTNYDIIVTKFGYIFPELKILAKSFIMSNTPGESYQNIEELKYKHLIRPIYPIDNI